MTRDSKSRISAWGTGATTTAVILILTWFTEQRVSTSAVAGALVTGAVVGIGLRYWLANRAR